MNQCTMKKVWGAKYGNTINQNIEQRSGITG